MARRARPHIFIGTSGWSYPHWVGPFYPETLDSREHLSYYARHFETVEVNNTFYRLPSHETVAAWRDETPAGFVFSCKASRFMTHMKKLKDPETSTPRFFETVAGLEGKLGPVLFQLPPRWRRNVPRLEAFLSALPGKYRFAFEFRDPSWFDPAVYELLRRFGAAFCIYDLDGRLSPLEVTADLVYVRLHGPLGPYEGRYDDKALRTWARRLKGFQEEGKTVFCYFDNDEQGYAVENALRLGELVGSKNPRTGL